jgi:hypothetical protein
MAILAVGVHLPEVGTAAVKARNVTKPLLSHLVRLPVHVSRRLYMNRSSREGLGVVL